MKRPRVGVLISGRGSNMQALVEAARDTAYPAEVALVLSNNPGAPGLEWARARQVATRVVDHRPYALEREAHERKVNAALQAAAVDLVALAGWMRLFTPWFVRGWRGRMIKHPPQRASRLPWLHTHRRALETG